MPESESMNLLKPNLSIYFCSSRTFIRSSNLSISCLKVQVRFSFPCESLFTIWLALLWKGGEIISCDHRVLAGSITLSNFFSRGGFIFFSFRHIWLFPAVNQKYPPAKQYLQFLNLFLEKQREYVASIFTPSWKVCTTDSVTRFPPVILSS